MPGLGLSFQPGVTDGAGSDRDSRVTPLQTAIQLLSLRVPSVSGGRSPVKPQLLSAAGSAGLSAGGMSQGAAIAWLRKLLQQSGGSVPPQARSLFETRPGGHTLSASSPFPSTPQPEPLATSIPLPRVRLGLRSPDRRTDLPLPPPPVEEFDYSTFDQPSYQAYQQANPDAPLSPYEWQTGQRF